MEANRRDFLKAGVAALSAPAWAQTDAAPWYRRTLRWGQTNITERDPARYDVAWWREYWKRTRVQGVIVNAGGIVAYYPSKFPLHRRAEFLKDRDLYGEVARAAHEDGLAVLARMDSNRTSEDFYKAHPDWFARDAKGDPYRAADKYITCVNSPYYDDYIPGVMTEIIERSRPEGLTDNSWSGLGRESICYCDHCARKFRERAGHPLPRKHDWDDPVYRQWIDWNYARRLEIWDLNNRATKAAGGPHCLWIGMNSGSITGQSRSFRDCKAIWERAEILMLDHQSRGAAGFQENTDTGKLIHGVMGWDKLIPESMAMYQAGRVPFRVGAKPAPEARMWMLAGFAGGIQPWWHHVGAYHEDRRAYQTAEPVMRWHEANERYLVDRRPVASVGLVWSQRNTDFYGRDDAMELVEQPYRGWMQALIRARIPYIPLHVDHIAREASNLKLIILPNVAAMSDAQCEAVRRFVQAGGRVVATGVTSLYNEWGEARADFALADLFGAHAPADAAALRRQGQSLHSYLRLAPELRANVWGPKSADAPTLAGQRHSVLRGFETTDIIGFGGALQPLRLDAGVAVPLTYVPPFPVYPPETAWMREPKTAIPGLVINGNNAYLPADIDRRYARENLPDHADLLANLARWGAGDSIPLQVEGPGLVECSLYAQRGRLVLHLLNLTAAGRLPLDELVPSAPLDVRLRTALRRVSFRVSAKPAAVRVAGGWVRFVIPPFMDHELVVIE